MHIVVSILIFAVIFFLLAHAIRVAIIGKGAYAEERVTRKLSRLPEEYHVFNDVYILNGNRSVQIDHVVISPYGLFVIETKNYKGWIYGSANSEHWTQNIYGNKYQLYNPTRQNASHVSALCKLFSITRDKTIPMIVFAGSATIQCSADCYVIYLSQLNQTIARHRSMLFSDKEVLWMVKRLSESLITGKNIKYEHAYKVQQQVAEKELMEANGICPRCHGQIVVREGKYGRFLGCSNYPKCKYTSNLQ